MWNLESHIKQLQDYKYMENTKAIILRHCHSKREWEVRNHSGQLSPHPWSDLYSKAGGGFNTLSGKEILNKTAAQKDKGMSVGPLHLLL